MCAIVCIFVGFSVVPVGQKHPSIQWLSQVWLASGLEQVSAQGLPHSLYSILSGHDFPVNTSVVSHHLGYVTSLIIFIKPNSAIVALLQLPNGLPTVQKYHLFHRTPNLWEEVVLISCYGFGKCDVLWISLLTLITLWSPLLRRSEGKGKIDKNAEWGVV